MHGTSTHCKKYCTELISNFLTDLLSTFSSSSSYTDVKIEREHVQGSNDPSGTIKPEIEPITEDTVRRMENPGSVEVCKSSSSNNKN